MNIYGFLLAAGLGTRFRPYTDKIPKPAIDFLDIPLLGYPLFYLESLPLSNVLVNTHHHPHIIEAVFEELSKGQPYSTCFSREEEILGSGGALWGARRELSRADMIVLANGDEVFFPRHKKGLLPIMNWHQSQGNWATLLVTNHPLVGQKFGGVWCDAELGVHGFGKQNPTSQNLKPLHYVGVLILDSSVWEFVPEGPSNILYDVVTEGIRGGKKVSAFYGPQMQWFEVGSPSDYLEGTGAILSQFWNWDEMIIELEDSFFKVGIQAQGSGGHLQGDEVYGEVLEQIIDRYRPSYEVREGVIQSPTAHLYSPVPGEFGGVFGSHSKVGSNVKMEGFVVVGSDVCVPEGGDLKNEVRIQWEGETLIIKR